MVYNSKCKAWLSLRFLVARYIQQVDRESNSQGISFGSIFLLFSHESSKGPHSQQLGEFPAPPLNDSPVEGLNYVLCFCFVTFLQTCPHNWKKKEMKYRDWKLKRRSGCQEECMLSLKRKTRYMCTSLYSLIDQLTLGQDDCIGMLFASKTQPC